MLKTNNSFMDSVYLRDDMMEAGVYPSARPTATLGDIILTDIVLEALAKKSKKEEKAR